jgi:hypothetical protein
MKHTALANANSKSNTKAKRRNAAVGYVMCLDNRGYRASLEVGKVYRLLSKTTEPPRGWLRVVDESGGDYLFPGARFARVELPAKAKRALAAVSV